MKKLLMSISVIAALILSQAAWADNRHNRRGYNSWGYSNYSGYNRYYGRSYSRGYNPYHYGYRRGRGYSNYYYGNRYYGGHRYDSGSFFGGLVLGSLLSYPRYSSKRYNTVTYRSQPVTQTREVVVVNNSTSGNSTPVASGRRLLRDLEGNCFERVVDEEGNEIRIQLEASECNF